jgi:hypothetical protein
MVTVFRKPYFFHDTYNVRLIAFRLTVLIRIER